MLPLNLQVRIEWIVISSHNNEYSITINAWILCRVGMIAIIFPMQLEHFLIKLTADPITLEKYLPIVDIGSYSSSTL